MTADLVRHPREGGGPDTLSPVRKVGWIPASAGMTEREHNAGMTRFVLTPEFDGPARQCGGAWYDLTGEWKSSDGANIMVMFFFVF